MKKLLCLTSILLLVCFFTLVACDESTPPDSVETITIASVETTAPSDETTAPNVETTAPSVETTAPNKCEHTEVVYAAVAPTCVTTGLTEGKYCSVCKAVLVAQTTVPALGHTEVIDKAVAPTCTATGLTEGKHCSTCKVIFLAQTNVPALGHTEIIDKAVESTCKATGLTEGKHCSACNTVLVEQKSSPLKAHTYDDKYDALCNVCGYERDTECVHTNQETVLGEEATCKKTGLTNGTKCLSCGETLVAQTIIPVKPHTEVVDKAVKATCTETGLTEGKHCSVCSTVFVAQTTVPAPGHTEVIDPAIPPTGTETGLTEGKHCSVCSTVLVAQTTVPAIGYASYTVEYYHENLDCTGYELVDTIIGEGITNSIVTAKINNYTHFTYNENLSTVSGKISGDGKQILKIYYSRNKYLVSTNIEGAATIDILGEHAYKTNIIISTITPNIGYIFDGWYINGEKVSSPNNLQIESNVEARFSVLTAMQNFIFESTQTACTITGVYDKTITELVVPNYVTNIKEKAFSECNALESITLPFVGTSEGVTGYGRHFGAIFSYWKSKNADYTKPYVQSGSYYYFFTIPSSLTNVTITGGSIREETFTNCDSIVNLVLEDGVTDIGNYAFNSCDSLKSVIIGDGVKTIGTGAFAGSLNLIDSTNAFALESVVIGSGVEKIGSYAFRACMQLQNVTIKEGVKVIGTNAFAECNELTQLAIPNSVTTIEYGAFMRCKKLEEILIPNSVTSVEEAIFSGCIKLSKVTLSNQLAKISAGMFSECISLTSIEIPDSVIIIDYMAFSSCSALTTVTAGNGLEYIGGYAFSGTSLTTFTQSNTSGWYRTTNQTDWENKENGTRAKPYVNSLKNTYSNHCWYRVR